jgi:hypothetical protein
MRTIAIALCLSLTSVVPALAQDTARALKTEIIDLAWDNIDNESNQAEIRMQMDALLGRLMAISPQVTESAMGTFSPGSWQQIWADERDMSPPGAPQRNLRQIYQVVSPEGWGYNFGVRTTGPNSAVTFALEVSASVIGNEQTTEITKAFLRPSKLFVGETLETIAKEIHSGTSLDFTPRNAGTFPNGPIGARGVLTIHFIDDELKIGTTNNVYTGASEFFVMQRTEVVR